MKEEHYHTEIISTLYDKDDLLENALNKLFYKAESLINQGTTIIVLSDRDFAENKVPMPILLALSGLYHYMLGRHNASKFAIIVDTAEVCEVHQFAALVGYGVSGIHPYGAYATLSDWGMGAPEQLENFRHAAEKGIVKVMSRMGISTIVGYKGAQLLKQLVYLKKSLTSTSQVRVQELVDFLLPKLRTNIVCDMRKLMDIEHRIYWKQAVLSNTGRMKENIISMTHK